jgi:hypothetical protein
VQGFSSHKALEGTYTGLMSHALISLYTCVCALLGLQTDILSKVNVVLALDKDDPAKEDSVKAVSSSSSTADGERCSKLLCNSGHVGCILQGALPVTDLHASNRPCKPC